MTTYPLATLAAQITDAGISAPSYADILESLKASYRSIYGSDAYLEADSQDGQWIAIQARAIHDSNSTAIAVYNSFSPSTAKGAGLSSVVKINGIARQVASRSTADVKIVGEVGRQIDNGQIGDGVHRWNLPAVVIIPPAGEIVVTATCAVEGAISAAAGTLTTILTPTFGWQSVTNDAPATEGAPVETDAQLRIRQTKSTALSAETPLEAVEAGVAAVPGVTKLRVYENDTSVPDADGISAHSVAVVVEGGDAQAIGGIIFAKKGPGTGTYGSTTVNVPDAYGVPKSVKFSRPSVQQIKVSVDLHPLTGYASTVGEKVVAALAAYINGLVIGADVYTNRLYTPANLPVSDPDSETFEIDAIQIAKVGDAFGTANIVIAFDEIAQIDPANITLTLV